MSQKNKTKTQLEQKDKLNSYARFSGISIQMIAIIMIGTFIGIKLDEAYPNLYNLYTLGFTLVAVIVSIVYVIRCIIATSNDNK